MSGLRVFQIKGIPIQLHISWFIIFALLTWSLATGLMPAEFPGLPTSTYTLMALVTSLLFFGSVLAHELGHAFVALRENIPVRGITLFIFGGVAEITKEPKSAGAEFRIAAAGPLVSLLLAILFGTLWAFESTIPWLAVPAIWLARINLTLAVFNLIPGYPLDGGRILKSIIWAVRKNQLEATRWASLSGQTVAVGFMGIGGLIAFTGNFVNGLWLGFIGWFLFNAASNAYTQAKAQHRMQGLRVIDIMDHRIPVVAPGTTIQQIVADEVIRGKQEAFLVGTPFGTAGLLTLKEIEAIPQRKWPFVTADQVMIPIELVKSVTPNTELLQAIQVLEENQKFHLPVIEDDRIIGIISLTDIMRILRLRHEPG